MTPRRRSSAEDDVSVPRLFPGSTVVCMASGPSLTADDVASCQGRARVVAVNDAVRYAPWADVLYACDRDWWHRHPETAQFAGLKFALRQPPSREDVCVLKQSGSSGLERDPGALRTGLNSGYQAINLAVHLGASRILLLGYDMQLAQNGRMHFYDKPPRRLARLTGFANWLPMFDTLVQPLKELGIEIVNCTRRTALTCFPCRSLAETLA